MEAQAEISTACSIMLAHNRWEEYYVGKLTLARVNGPSDGTMHRSHCLLIGTECIHFDVVHRPDDGSGCYSVWRHISGHLESAIKDDWMDRPLGHRYSVLVRC